MLRHLHGCRLALRVAWVALAGSLVAGSLVACSPAPPVQVGVDSARLTESEGPAEPEVPPLTDELDDEGIPPAQIESILDFNDFIDSSVERGEVSPFCRSSFQACGGLLAGTWVVEDNCNPEIRTRDVLQSWGKTRMDLDETACWDAVQRLRWNWSGELRFEAGVAIDKRERKQQVDMQLTSRCLSASFGIERTDSVSPQLCNSIQDETTTCGLANGVCLCSNRTVSTGTASGTYGVLGLSVAIGETPIARFDYCVDGDMLLWREKEGALRHVVLRRTVDPPPGTVDPVEVPR